MSIADLDDRQRQVAIQRARLLKKYTDLRRSGMTAAAARKEIDISPATHSRWSKAQERYGLVGLADRTGERRGGQSVMNDTHKMFLYKTALTQHQPKLMSIYREDYIKFCASLAEHPVSYHTFLRVFNSIPETVKTYYRKGSKAFANAMPHHIRDWNLVKSMDVIFSDHVELNFFVRVKGKSVRPWVTWWMDGHSRKALAWVVTLRPNQDTILLSLLHTLKQYGSPNYAYTDNGKDYASIALNGVNAEGKKASKMEIVMDETMISGAYQSLHIEPIFATPYNAQAKPIEPAHNFLHNWTRNISYGYAGANILDRPEYMQTGVKVKGQKNTFDISRLMSWDEGLAKIDEMFESYNVHEHKGLINQFDNKSMNPLTAFEIGFDQEVFKIWKSIVDEKALTLLMMRVEGKTYKVHSNGINFKKHYYFHEILIEKQMEGERAIIRHDPFDIDENGVVKRIYIYDAKDRFVCGAPIFGMTHPVAATEEDYARIGHAKKLKTETTKKHYEDATNLYTPVSKSDMSF